MAKPFIQIADAVEPTAPAPAPQQRAAEDTALAQLRALAVTTLSQNALTVLSMLFTGGALASAFLLWQLVLPAPDAAQLVGCALYGGFLLAIEYIRRKH